MSNLAREISTSVLDLDPVRFIERLRTIKGKPFRLRGVDEKNEPIARDYLMGFYRHCAFELPKKESPPVVVVKGRQVEFTETSLNLVLYYLRRFSYFNALYAFPRQDQVGRFSRDRLKSAIDDSIGSEIKSWIVPSVGADTVGHKEFKNGNILYMGGAWGEADALRNIAADALFADEFQDWTQPGYEATSEALGHSEYRINIALGTPKRVGSNFFRMWDRSDQRLFHPRCIQCQNTFLITLENFKYKLMVECPHCRKLQDKRYAIANNGEWIASRPSNSANLAGFHVSQLLAPWITREEIDQKSDAYGDRRFQNEVLGNFYSGLSAGLSPDDLERDTRFRLSKYVTPPTDTFVGLDWGTHTEEKQAGSYTTIVVISRIDFKKFKIEYCQRFLEPDYLKQVAQISTLLREFNCRVAVADSSGAIQVQELRKSWQNKIVTCFYGAPAGKEETTFNPKRNMITADKHLTLDICLENCKRKCIVIPYKSPEETEWLIDDICSVESDTLPAGGTEKKVWVKIPGKTDDGLQALNYALLASKFLATEGQSGIIGSSRIGKSGGFAKPIGTTLGIRRGGWL
jgi:hypothetical protein